MTFSVALDFIVNKILFWTLASLIALETYNVIFHKGIPNIRMAPAIRKRVRGLIHDDFDAHNGNATYTILDLGSGNGRLTREIATELPGAGVIGIEIARLSVAWSNWMKRRAGIGNLAYAQTDFLTYDMSKADAIVMYLLPMPGLGKKLRDEAKPGTLIICNKFPLHEGWVVEETIPTKTLYFHQKDIHVYRKK